jgi:hypothetical protein
MLYALISVKMFYYLALLCLLMWVYIAEMLMILCLFYYAILQC